MFIPFPGEFKKRVIAFYQPKEDHPAEQNDHPLPGGNILPKVHKSIHGAIVSGNLRIKFRPAQGRIRCKILPSCNGLNTLLFTCCRGKIKKPSRLVREGFVVCNNEIYKNSDQV